MSVLTNVCHLFFILSILLSIENSTAIKECTDTNFMLSKCYDDNKNQWLVEVPKKKDSCEGKTIAPPRNVPCNLVCPSGQALNTETIRCNECSPGQYSIGSGQEYVFDKLNSSIDSKTIILDAVPLVKESNSLCNKTSAWKNKNNVLQGEVQKNCALGLWLKFKLERSGAVIVTYSLPTSFVFLKIKSRCDLSSTKNADEEEYEEDVEEGFKRSIQTTLHSTGYGNWSKKKIKIDEAGEYWLQLYVLGLSSFHFPLSIRSIIIEGTLFFNECNDCPPGTYTDVGESSSCKPCPSNTYTPEAGSTKCKKCDVESEYSDPSGTKCKQRPKCKKSDYRKVFQKCDDNNMAEFKYIPIEPKICQDDIQFERETPISCGKCNPGTFKNQTTKLCDFCPPKMYSDGSSKSCQSCPSDLSLVNGLYYKYWDELPIYFNRSFISFDDEELASQLLNSQSWIPSVTFIYSRPLVDTLAVLSLTILKGFEQTNLAKMNKVYGTLYFNFSVECEPSCMLSLISQNIYDDDSDEWSIIHKWKFNNTFTHEKIIDYTYSIPHSDPVMFGWLFASESEEENLAEVRIYEIRVTNTKIGGSDRCIACLTTDNKETECKSCSPGHVLANNSCVRCPEKSIASRSRSTDLVMNKCSSCPNNAITDDGVSCYIPCKQKFNGDIVYDLNSISTIEYQGPKLFTQKGSGYYHLFNATICGQTDVICTRTPSDSEKKRVSSQMQIQSKLCRMGTVPNSNENSTGVAYIDDFGEELVEVSLRSTAMFPALRSDYNLSDITLVYRKNVTGTDSACSERITYLSLRCDHDVNENVPSSNKNYTLQVPNKCVTGTCDGCQFHFLLRTPLACPVCEENNQGYRTFEGACKFGHQEVRQVPYPFCSHILKEKVESRKCSAFTMEVQILIGLFLLVALILVSIVLLCWRKNRKLEYRYMQLVENVNPDDDKSVDNVCAQLSDEDEEAEEVHFKQSKTKKMLNAVRSVIGRKPNQGRSDVLDRNTFLLTDQMTNDA